MQNPPFRPMPPTCRPQQQNGYVPPVCAQPSPLSAAVTLAEYIRAEQGRQGVCSFVTVICPLVPRTFLDQLCRALSVELPPPPPPPPPPLPPPPPPPKQELPIGQLMQMMRLFKGDGK